MKKEISVNEFNHLFEVFNQGWNDCFSANIDIFHPDSGFSGSTIKTKDADRNGILFVLKEINKQGLCRNGCSNEVYLLHRIVGLDDLLHIFECATDAGNNCDLNSEEYDILGLRGVLHHLGFILPSLMNSISMKLKNKT